MKKIQIILLAFGIIFFSACKKEINSPIGKQGIAGENGKLFLSGTGAPATTSGNIGEFYLDITAGKLYGPKTDKGWGVAISLQQAAGDNGNKGGTGANGTNGANGATLLNGTIAPQNTVGNLGDYYFDTQSLAIFGPKLNSGWGSPISLKAPEQNMVAYVFENILPTVITAVTTNDGTFHNSIDYQLKYDINLDSYKDKLKDKTLLYLFQNKEQNDLYWSTENREFYNEFENYDNNGTYFSHQGVPIIKPNEVQITNAKVNLYSEKNLDESYFNKTKMEEIRKLSGITFKIIAIPTKSLDYLSVNKIALKAEDVAKFLRLNN